MSRYKVPPGGGAIPTARPDHKMGAEHPRSLGPWRGSWSKMVKRSATKKRRQRDRQEAEG